MWKTLLLLSAALLVGGPAIAKNEKKPTPAPTPSSTPATSPAATGQGSATGNPASGNNGNDKSVGNSGGGSAGGASNPGGNGQNGGGTAAGGQNSSGGNQGSGAGHAGGGSGQPVVCTISDLGAAAGTCSGFFRGNLLGGSGDKVAAQLAGLQQLGYAWSGDWSSVLKIDSLNGSTTLDFGKPLFGETIIGLHFGGGGSNGVGNGTAFYKLDLGTGTSGLAELALAYAGSSGAVLYKTSVQPVVPNPNVGSAIPEPAMWAMMIGGFGLVGAAARPKSRPSVELA